MWCNNGNADRLESFFIHMWLLLSERRSNVTTRSRAIHVCAQNMLHKLLAKLLAPIDCVCIMCNMCNQQSTVNLVTAGETRRASAEQKNEDGSQQLIHTWKIAFVYARSQFKNQHGDYKVWIEHKIRWAQVYVWQCRFACGLVWQFHLTVILTSKLW